MCLLVFLKIRKYMYMTGESLICKTSRLVTVSLPESPTKWSTALLIWTKMPRPALFRFAPSKATPWKATGAHLVFVDGTSVPLRADAVQVSDILEGNVVTKIGVVTKFVFKRL